MGAREEQAGKTAEPPRLALLGDRRGALRGKLRKSAVHSQTPALQVRNPRSVWLGSSLPAPRSPREKLRLLTWGRPVRRTSRRPLVKAALPSGCKPRSQG